MTLGRIVRVVPPKDHRLPARRGPKVWGARKWLPVLVVLALVVGAAGPGLASAGSDGVARSKPTWLKPSKVTYIVEQFAREVAAARARGQRPSELSNAVLHAFDDGSIEVAIHALGPITRPQVAQLRLLGGTHIFNASGLEEIGLADLGLAQARVPFDRIDDAALLPWIAAITPPNYAEPDPHPTNPLNSEGVPLHNADDVQTRGLTGAGVTVGVMSNGVAGLAQAQAQNELPAVTVFNNGGGAEGTAMLEIVHDMAPGATLIYDDQNGVAGYVASFATLVGGGANVITEDLAFDQEPAFQQGAGAAAGENTATGGVSVHSSAGNQALRHAARVAGTGTGSGPDGTAGPYTNCTYDPINTVAIAPGGDTTFDVTLGQGSGSGSTFVLQWSEPRSIAPTAGAGGFTDLDLFVMDTALTQCYGESIAVQGDGAGDTMEVVQLPTSLAGTTAKVVVEAFGGSGAAATPLIDLRWRRTGGSASDDATTRAGSLNPDSNYTGLATSSAAVDAVNGGIEPYSSGGPVQLGSTTVCTGGAYPCPGASTAGTIQNSAGPTWTAADNVTVSGVAGFGSPFTGTSAAAPHAAGCDALLRSSALSTPNDNPANTNARLAQTALDLDSPGPDNVAGAGQLDCLLAVNRPPVANPGGPYVTNEGADVPLSGLGSSDPDTGDSIAAYEWDLDNDGFFDDSTSATPTFTDVGQDGVFTVRLRVTDTAGVTHEASTTVQVDNVAPTVEAITTDGPKFENDPAPLSISGVISDPGWEDSLTATIDFGDGLGSQPLTGITENTRPDSTLTYNLTHNYGDNGIYTITICAADDDTVNNCNTTPVTINNVDPTATTPGTLLINGKATLIGEAGVPLTFTGESDDPGSDDETFLWDWDDPTPNEGETYLVNPPVSDPPLSPSVQPREDVTDQRPHTYAEACLYLVDLTVTDDDGGSAAAEIGAIIQAPEGAKRRPNLYWQHEMSRKGRVDHDEATLNCYLAIADWLSAVFSEETDASTIPLAYDVLFKGGNQGSAAQKLDRELLTAWLNFANGAIDYNELFDTDGDGVIDTQFATIMTNAETVRLDNTATDAQLDEQRTIVHRVNNG